MKLFCLFAFVLLISSGHCDDRSRADGAAEALMKYYNHNSGLWNTTGWWNGANALTSIIDYMILTGTKQYVTEVQNTFEKAIHHPGTKNFTNEYIDDCGWWGLAWVRAYDLTHDQKYLQMAEHISDYMYSYHDNVCKGGLYWKTDKKNKNAIPNELFIKLSASLHNRIGAGDSKYLKQAKEVWDWFKGTGMINSHNLINDGLDGLQACKVGGQTFTYNQGVILGGLIELNKATDDRAYLNEAETIANATTKSTFLSRDGILTEPIGPGCGGDGPSFKGVFVRNLGELSRALGNHPYHAYLEKNAQTAFEHDRNNNNQYGLSWAGPLKETAAACQHSAVDLMNAALKS